MIINIFQFLSFLLVSFLLSTIDVFNVFSNSNLITFIQSLSLVYLLFFDMYSFVTKTALDVKRAVLLVNTIPMLGFINDIVELVIVDPDPIKIQ